MTVTRLLHDCTRCASPHAPGARACALALITPLRTLPLQVHVAELVTSGRMREEVLDIAVRKVLRVKSCNSRITVM